MKTNLGIILLPYDSPAAIEARRPNNTISLDEWRDTNTLKMLFCPSGTEIVDRTPYAFFSRNLYAIKIYHENLPGITPGNVIPYVYLSRSAKGPVYCWKLYTLDIESYLAEVREQYWPFITKDTIVH